MNSPLSMTANTQASLESQCLAMAQRAKRASRLLATLPGSVKDAWLLECAKAIESSTSEIIAANALDIAAAPTFGLNAAAIDRLKLTAGSIAGIAKGIREIAAQRDPIGETIEGWVRMA